MHIGYYLSIRDMENTEDEKNLALFNLKGQVTKHIPCWGTGV